ncbi:MAG: response regulator [Planctomycetota bacterium]
MSIRFHQQCPTCGRRIDVRAELLGRTVACQHCMAEFVATANDDLDMGSSDVDNLLARAEAMLERTSTVARA